MKVQSKLFRKRNKKWLHLFFAATLFLYLYGPLLDHWLGNTEYGRPHTHIALAISDDVANITHKDGTSAEHEESVLCLLSLVSLLSAAPDINLQWSQFEGFSGIASLVFNIESIDETANPIFLSSIDPPPRS